MSAEEKQISEITYYMDGAIISVALISHKDNIQNLKWVIDSGATDNYCTENMQVFTSYEPCRRAISVGGGHTVMGIGIGTVHGIHNVVHAPNLKYNLLSVGAMTRQGFKFDFKKKQCIIYQTDSKKKVFGVARLKQGLYRMNLQTHTTKHDQALIGDYKPQNLAKLWHSRLNHMSYQTLKKITAKASQQLKGVSIPRHHFDDKKGLQCDICALGKITSKGLPKKSVDARDHKPLDTISIDLMGPIKPRSRAHCKYTLVIVDVKTKYAWVRFIAKKSEAAEKMKEFINLAASHLNDYGSIKRIRSDNGKEFINEKMTKLVKKNDIIHETTVPYNSGQNGIAERFIRTITTNARCNLMNKKMANNLWDEAVSHAVHVYNRLPHGATGKTPIAMLKGKHPNLSYLRIFGADVTVLDEQISKSNRFKARGTKGTFLGYAQNCKGYRVLDAKTNKIYVRRHVHFNEVEPETKQSRAKPHKKVSSKAHKSKKARASNNKLNENKISKRIMVDDNPESEEEPEDYNIHTDEDDTYQSIGGQPNVEEAPVDDYEREEGKKPTDDEASTEEEVSQIRRSARARRNVVRMGMTPADDEASADEEIPSHRRSTRTRKNVERMGMIPGVKSFEPVRNNISLTAIAMQALKASVIHGRDIKTPRSYKTATRTENPYREEWKGAVKRELESMENLNVWTPVVLPKERKALRTTWVFKAKLDNDNRVKRFKARLCAMGNFQKEGIDYSSNTWAPVSRLPAVRTYLISMVNKGYKVTQMDVSTAYLWAPIKEDVYIMFPHGYENEDPTKNCLKLNKCIYGLKQAANAWYNELLKTLNKHGLKAIVADRCIYHKKVGEQEVYVLTFVDDILVSGHPKLVNGVAKLLKDHYKISIEDDITQLLGMRININQKNKSVTMDTEAYLHSMLEKFDMTMCKPVTTPMTEVPDKEEDLEAFPDPKHYMSAIGSLMYASLACRPDLTYSVGKLARKMANPSLGDWMRVKRVMRYIKGTINLGLFYDCKENILNVCYSDSDWGGDKKTSKSTSGGLILPITNCSPTEWFSKLQRTITLSTAIAELNAVTETVKMGMWHRLITKEMNNKDNDTVHIKCDNASAVKLASNTVQHSKIKHVMLKIRFIQEKIANNKVSITYVRTDDNIADLMTKALPRPKFEHFVNMIMKPIKGNLLME